MARLVLAVGVPLLLSLSGTAPAQAHALSADSPTPSPGAVEETAANGEPLTAADRELLVKVRLAGLWERPAGLMAAKKGVNPRVRQIGPMIATQHRQLDALVVKAAQEVGVPLPDTPNPEQQGWLNEMAAASGDEFDQIFVARLRAAHGKVFPVIANVRAGTRNSVVRELAQSANDFVLTHLTLLESTDLVDFSSLPLPPQPSPTPTASPAKADGSVVGHLAGLSRSAGGLTVPVLVLLAVVVLVGRLVRRRPSRTSAPRYRRPVTPAVATPYRRPSPGNRGLSSEPDGDEPSWTRLTHSDPDRHGLRSPAPDMTHPRY